jgi:hypothetical protein
MSSMSLRIRLNYRYSNTAWRMVSPGNGVGDIWPRLSHEAMPHLLGNQIFDADRQRRRSRVSRAKWPEINRNSKPVCLSRCIEHGAMIDDLEADRQSRVLQAS